MGFQANVLRVMIASPGDVKEEREIVTKEIHRWNDAHAFSRKLVLQPVKWDTHSTPQLGAPAQEVLNKQILDDSDILIGIFGTRVGTPTEGYVSGTVEEIKRHVAAGKTAKVYFSDVPVSPSQVDQEQYQLLQKFKEECRKLGLYATYGDLTAFRESIQQHLAIELNQARYMWLAEPSPWSGKNEPDLSPEAKRALIAAAEYQGGITTLPKGGGEIIYAGGEMVSDGSVRATALWREVFKDLLKRGLIEALGSTPGNYRMTAAGLRIVDKFKEEEEKNKQLEIELKVTGSPTTQALEVTANKQIHLRQLEFLTTAGVCTAHEDVDVDAEEAKLPIDHSKVVKLLNAPRSDANRNDLSGPAIIRLTYARGAITNSVELPVMIQPVFINSGMGPTQYVTLAGQKRFYI